MNPKHEMELAATEPTKSLKAGLAGAPVADPGALPTRVGPYRVLGPLGAGGMGVVLRARHGDPDWARLQGGDVALRLMHPHLAADPMLRERFLDEAATGLRLDHPGIARVYEVVEEGCWLGMAMERVEGPTLEAWARGPTPAAAVLQVLKPLASALDHLYGLGVIHRDVKPANVKLRPTGQPVLLDWGVSRGAYRPRAVETTVGMTVGTRWGMSPDQEQEKDCSARSDVYSLGLVTYRLLSGQMPWAASSPDGMETVNKALGHLVKREGGASVRAVVMSALSTNWTDRPESCGAFVTALEEAVASDEARRRSADVARSEAACDPLSAYESFRVGEGQLELRRIGPQRFEMGSLEDDEGANDDERPQRWVTLTREFAMGVFPVTQGQYVAVMGENPSLHREADAAAHHPVENVTWFDAVRFCNKLSRLHGLRPAYTIGPGDAPDVRCDWTSPGFRLPTEAEWECAARAGAGHTLAYSGGEAPDEVAWTVENSDGETRPVGLLRPNAWGLYDMSGNVWEWVWDCVLIVGRLMPFYDEGPVTDPQGSTEGSNRVNRGGGWDSSAASARVAIRDFDDPSDCNVNLGFRIARTVHLDTDAGAKARAEAETHQLGATHAAAVAYESHQLGEVSFRLCSLGAERFWMGSEEGVGYEGERPRHEVSLRSFGIGEYLVTQGLWHAVMGSNPSFFAGARRPVEQVTWFDAVRFCNLLSEKMGLEPPYTIGAGVHPEVTCDWRRGGFRLPTEAEWECAAKGGGETQFAGSEVLDEFGWYGGNSGGQTHDVGQKRANAYGLFDASGNLWEWCWDWYAAYSGGPAHDPRGPTAGSGRVRRGGCWVNAAALARVARRLFAAPALCSNSIGFRLARTIP